MATYRTQTERGTRYDIEIVVVRNRRTPYVIFDNKQAYNLYDYSIEHAEELYFASIRRNNRLFNHD